MEWKGTELEDLLEKVNEQKALFSRGESSGDYVLEAVYDMEAAEWIVQLYDRTSSNVQNLTTSDTNTDCSCNKTLINQNNTTKAKIA